MPDLIILPCYVGGPRDGDTVPPLPDDIIRSRQLRVAPRVPDDSDLTPAAYRTIVYTLEQITPGAPSTSIYAWVISGGPREQRDLAAQALSQAASEIRILHRIRTMLRHGRWDIEGIAKLATPEAFNPDELKD